VAGAATPAAVLCERITALRAAARTPVLVALDGRSGAGKSTLAGQVGAQVGALVIDGDDFYSGRTDGD
jgi:uridine kinase